MFIRSRCRLVLNGAPQLGSVWVKRGGNMRKVYLDNAATTPILPEVREAMLPYLGKDFGNPSCLHEWGDAAREGMESARSQTVELIGANPEEIIFTGSGTESNNFAVKGLALAQQNM
jgi:cysteine desulfurase